MSRLKPGPAMLDPDELERYARHIVLREIGGPGQAALKRARVLIIGAGGLGAPALLYLAAAGVGTLGVVDDDNVALSNLQRQVIHGTPEIGMAKVDSAAAAIRRLNPHVVVTGAVGIFDGTLTTIRAHERGSGGRPNPTYRCLFPQPPPPGSVPACAEAGILGALTGVLGSLMALEVIREIVGFGEGLVGRLLMIDARALRFEILTYGWDPANPLSGEHPTIRSLTTDEGRLIEASARPGEDEDPDREV